MRSPVFILLTATACTGSIGLPGGDPGLMNDTEFQNAAMGVRDPGVRGGPARAGTPIAGLSAAEAAFFQFGHDQFVEIESVQG